MIISTEIYLFIVKLDKSFVLLYFFIVYKDIIKNMYIDILHKNKTKQIKQMFMCVMENKVYFEPVKLLHPLFFLNYQEIILEIVIFFGSCRYYMYVQVLYVKLKHLFIQIYTDICNDTYNL